MSNKLRNIFSNSLVKNTMKLSSSNLLMFLLPIIVTPILSRIYSQESYGDWGIFSSTFMIINSILFLSYENAIVKVREEREVATLCKACGIVASCMILFVCIAFTIGRFIGIDFFIGFPHFDLLVLLLFITIFSQVLYNLSNRYEKYSLMAISNIIQGTAQATFRLLFSIFHQINGLIAGNVAAQIMTIISYSKGLKHQVVQIYKTKVSFHEIKAVLAKYKKFPLFDAPGLILETAIGNLALIILSLFFSKEIIGCYSIIFQFMVLPISLVGSAMSKVYYKEISIAQTQNEIANITKRVTKITFILSLIPIIFIVCGGDYFITWYLGKKWEISGNISLCLSIMSVPIILSESLLPLFRKNDKQQTRFIFDLLCFSFGIGGLYYACNLSSNIYVVLITYVVLYSIIRYSLFFKILHDAQVKSTFKEIFIFVFCISICNIVAIIRLYQLFHH